MKHQGGHEVGEVIGSKELVSYVGLNSHRHHLWMVKCFTCKSVSGPTTIAHTQRSEKLCRNCQYVRENNGRWKGYRELTGVWLGQYKLDAAKKNREWSVTPEDLWAQWETQRGRCAYTNWELTHGVDASLDRIDSSLGYTPENIQWVHRNINRMKSDFSEEDFIRMCLGVAVMRGL